MDALCRYALEYRYFMKIIDLVFDEAVTEALMEPGNYPGSSGTRNLGDNLSDLKAQVASNQKVDQYSNTLLLCPIFV